MCPVVNPKFDTDVTEQRGLLTFDFADWIHKIVSWATAHSCHPKFLPQKFEERRVGRLLLWDRTTLRMCRMSSKPPPARLARCFLGLSVGINFSILFSSIIVGGGWSPWSPYSRCTLTCNGGTQIRSRTCSNPFPLHGGRACPGHRLQRRTCNIHPCPGGSVHNIQYVWQSCRWYVTNWVK